MKNIALLLVAAFSMCFLSPAGSEEPRWGWFAAISNANKWDTETGMADIVISGKTFHAKLYIGDYLRHEIRGTISGSTLKVLLSTSETDQVDYPLEGLHRKTFWEDVEVGQQTVGRETIELTGAGLVVGFTREIMLAPPLKPGTKKPD